MRTLIALLPETIPGLRPPRAGVLTEQTSSSGAIALGLGMALLLGLAGAWLWRKRMKKPKIVPSAESIALASLQDLLCPEARPTGQSILCILRRYLESVLALESRERTSPELMAILSKSRLNADSLSHLADLLRDCDLMAYSPAHEARAEFPVLVQRALTLVGQIEEQCRSAPVDATPPL